MTPRRFAPFWFQAAILALWVAVCHLLDLHALEHSPVSVAFFGWLIALGEIIWNALQGLGQITLAALEWTVNALWIIARDLRNGLTAFGRDLLAGFKTSWGFLRGLYDEILKPAWLKFWHLVDTLTRALDKLFRPVFAFLRTLRDELLAFYTKWVRPILDTIGAMQQILRVLEALHIAWAKRLDAELSRIAEAIDRPFRFALEKINEVINLVNRIVTLDGALQRLLFVKTLQRDWQVIGDEYATWHKTPLTPDELEERRRRKYDEIDPASPGEELGKFYRGDGGEFDGIIRELLPEWRVAAGVTGASSTP